MESRCIDRRETSWSTIDSLGGRRVHDVAIPRFDTDWDGGLFSTSVFHLPKEHESKQPKVVNRSHRGSFDIVFESDMYVHL